MYTSDIYNPPGQSKLNYRFRTHSGFFDEMIHILRRQEAILPDGSKSRPLINMRTRDKDDPVIALIDSWAMTLDILTFYQERIANEGYLETAAERLSTIELARTVGYEMSQGKGATVFLAFTVDDSQITPDTVNISAKTRISGIPSVIGQLPPIFETQEDFTARLKFNALKPATNIQENVTIKKGALSVTVRRLDVYVNSGSKILIKGSDNYQIITVDKISYELEEGNTVINLSQPLEADIDSPEIYIQRERASLFGSSASNWSKMSTEARLIAIYGENFGYTSYIDLQTLPQETQDKVQSVQNLSQWPNFNTAGSDIDLDSLYTGLWTGNDEWIALSGPGLTELYGILDIAEAYRSDFYISSKITRITVDRELAEFNPLEASVVIFGSKLEAVIAADLIQEPECIEIKGKLSDLVPSMFVLIAGVGQNEEELNEIAVIKKVETSDTTTCLTFEEPIKNVYVRESISINANILKAVQGETISDEILGSGNAALANQRFVLKRKPIVLNADEKLDIKVWVNGVLWNQVESLYWYDEEDRVYMARTDDSQNTYIIFGDGVNGSRLPTGQENVKATYRICDNIGCNILPQTLKFLSSCPLGISEVVNPKPPADFREPETLEHAVSSLILKGGTHDRIISVTDCEKFAGSFPGIDKATAVKFELPGRQIIYITAAGTDGSDIVKDSKTYKDLIKKLKEKRSSNCTILIDSYIPAYPGIEADIFFDSSYNDHDVENRVRKALLDSFSFDKQDIGKDIRKSDIIRVIQDVEAVIYVKVKRFFDSVSGLDVDTAVNRNAYWNYQKNRPEPAQMVFLDSEKSLITLNLISN